MSVKDLLLNPGRHCVGTSLGLLIIRVATGLFMALGHGWGKLTGFGDMVGQFPDPLGVGSGVGLAVAVFAEFFCALAVALGFGTRILSIPVAVVMFVAAFAIHGDDPWARQELALLYAIPFFAMMFMGAGRFSIDALICKERGYDKSCQVLADK